MLVSTKDRAELLMIVDLLRNDLGRIAETGSVAVDRLFGTEVYSSVIHLVADVSCQIRKGVHLDEILAALLPGGSVTGAPKRRAIELLQEIETGPRWVYTGNIGYVCGDRADFSIAIRTIVSEAGKFLVHAGGGIVADSQVQGEYDEMRLKAKNLLAALGIVWPDNDSQR